MDTQLVKGTLSHAVKSQKAFIAAVLVVKCISNKAVVSRLRMLILGSVSEPLLMVLLDETDIVPNTLHHWLQQWVVEFTCGPGSTAEWIALHYLEKFPI